MRRLLIAGVLALALFAFACSSDDSGDSGEDSGDAASGEEVFQGTCAGCHGQDANGIEGSGKDISNTDFINDTPDEELVAFIKEGRPADDPDNTTGVAMPPKGGNASLTDADIEAVVVYLKGLS
ncbi:MAG: hypothetical protein JJLCMIEE_02560 [Acidimicrobiales bacterium]|nr:hypothetical protein [Acidimicrobiales bacterium]